MHAAANVAHVAEAAVGAQGMEGQAGRPEDDGSPDAGRRSGKDLRQVGSNTRMCVNVQCLTDYLGIRRVGMHHTVTNVPQSLWREPHLHTLCASVARVSEDICRNRACFVSNTCGRAALASVWPAGI